MKGSVILCYHRVLPVLQTDPLGILDHWQLQVELRRFEQHMEIVARRFRVVPLHDLLGQLVDGFLRPGQASVTFDDGYADNYSYAFPVLRRMGIPATIFLTTENVGRGVSFWWDRLVWAIPPAGKDVLQVPSEIGGTIGLDSRDSARAALLQVFRRMRVLENAQKRDELLDALGAPMSVQDGAPLTWDEAREMQREGVSFGAHTRFHPSLVALSDAALREEIEGSRDRITQQLGTSPITFAYPFGHADERVSGAVQAAGFLGAVTTRDGLCTATSPRYLLPRLGVHNWNRHFFERYVEVLSQTGLAIGDASHPLELILKSVLPVPVLKVSAHVRARLTEGNFAKAL